MRIKVTYGNPTAKKHSVRFEPLSTDNEQIAPSQLSDIYVPLNVLALIGMGLKKTESRINVTYELYEGDK